MHRFTKRGFQQVSHGTIKAVLEEGTQIPMESRKEGVRGEN